MPKMTKEDYEKYGSYANKMKHEEKPSYENHIEGVGTIKVYGELNVEKLIRKLLTYESITGK